MDGIRRPGRWPGLALFGALIAAVAVLGAACTDSDEGEGGEDAAEAMADDRGYAEGARLVTTEWLAEHLDDEDLVVVDLRDPEDYAAGHIPGAVNIVPGDVFNRVDENGVPGQIALRETVAAGLSAAGISPDDTIVLYDGARNLWSARAIWVLSVYGHENARILDGSWALWESESREVSTETPAVEATEYVFATEPNDQLIANFEEISAAVGDPESLVCDARSAEEYTGRDVRSAQGGHVPGAVNEDWVQALDDQGRFKGIDDLRAVYEDSGLISDDSKTVYVYCQTGVRAAHTWFVLHDLIGLPNVVNYDGSWEEYGNREDAEIERS